MPWIAQGKRNAEIAGIVGASVHTIGKHVENVLAKFNAETRGAAVASARSRLASSNEPAVKSVSTK